LRGRELGVNRTRKRCQRFCARLQSKWLRKIPIQNSTARSAIQKLFPVQWRTFLFLSTTNFQHSFPTLCASTPRFIGQPFATMLRSKESRLSHSQPLTASTSSKLQNDIMIPGWSFRALSEPPMGRVSKRHRNTCKSTTPLAVRAMFTRRTRSVNSINIPNNEDLKARNKMLFAAKRHALISNAMDSANIECDTFPYIVVSEKLPQFSGQWTRVCSPKANVPL